jgi:predicted ATPase
MIERLHVVGFKSLADVAIDLGRVNVFIGANGAGKSNILEALGIASAAISGQVDDESIRRRGVRLGLPALYKSSFRGTSIPKHIRFELGGSYGEHAKYQVSLYNPIGLPERTWRYKHELLTDGKRSLGRSPASLGYYDDRRSWIALSLAEVNPKSSMGRLASALAAYSIYAPDTPTLRGTEPDLQDREPIGLAGGSLPQGVREILSSGKRRELISILDHIDWVRSVRAAPTSTLPIATGVSQHRLSLRFVDKFMVEGRNVLSGYDASEGVLYLLFIAVLALHDKSPNLFAIDNFDQALNPRMAREAARLFCNWMIRSNTRQALLTTHNPLVLDGLPLLDDKVRLFAVDRNLKGQTVIQRVKITEKVMRSSKDGVPLSQQWVMGNFRGVPAGV